MRKKDTLYSVNPVAEDFSFNDQVVAVFDDMIQRSVPFYDAVIDAMPGLLEHILHENDSIYDLGCSTGETILRLAGQLNKKKLRYIGVDNAPAMLDCARKRVQVLMPDTDISFIENDVSKVALEGAGAALCNYTLQFIRPQERAAFIQRIYKGLRPGGVLLLSEKILSADKYLNREFIHQHHNFKRLRGYSELEIARKREALENVLIPFTLDENKLLLQEAGFTAVDSFFQWFNFAALIAVK